MTDPKFRYRNDAQTSVVREWPDGRQESYLTTAPEYLAWLAQGNEPDPIDLASQKAAKLEAIEAAFDGAVSAGMPTGDKILQIDAASRQNIAAIATRAIGVVTSVPGMTWPVGFAWRMADNSWLPVTAAELLAMAQAAADFYTGLILHRASLKDAVAAAEDAADVEAVDANAGWS